MFVCTKLDLSLQTPKCHDGLFGFERSPETALLEYAPGPGKDATFLFTFQMDECLPASEC